MTIIKIDHYNKVIYASKASFHEMNEACSKGYIVKIVNPQVAGVKIKFKDTLNTMTKEIHKV